MHTDTTVVPSRRLGARIAYAALALSLLVAIVLEIGRHDTGYWQLVAFGVGPDLALLFGAAAGLEKGQLHPRAVPLYNLLHRYRLAVVLAVLAAFGVVPPGFFVGALVWALHISFDRAVGYGLRTRDGFQRS
jgi:hypothetical protein